VAAHPGRHENVHTFANTTCPTAKRGHQPARSGLHTSTPPDHAYPRREEGTQIEPPYSGRPTSHTAGGRRARAPGTGTHVGRRAPSDGQSPRAGTKTSTLRGPSGAQPRSGDTNRPDPAHTRPRLATRPIPGAK
jgi:hypothetical protein